MEEPTFRCFIIDVERFSYRPRHQLELAVRAGIGSVLSKRQWWLKWCGVHHGTDDAMAGKQSVRESWLDEIVTAVLQNRFYWMTKHWRCWFIGYIHRCRQRWLKRLVHFPPFDDAEDKRHQQHQSSTRARIAYAFFWDPEWQDALREEPSDDESLDDESFDDESFDDESFDSESLDGKSLHDESLDDESFDNESMDDELLDGKSFDNESSGSGSFDGESFDNESSGSGSFDGESFDNESLGDESLDDEWSDDDHDEDFPRCCLFENNTFRTKFEALDSTSVLCWYFAVLALSQQIDRRSSTEWPRGATVNLGDESVRRRAIDLIKAAYDGDVTKASFTTLYPDADDRPQAVDLIWFHVERAVQQVKSVRACVRATLDDLIDRHDLMNPASVDGFISPGPVIETWMSDSIVPADVKAKFVREVAVLENVPEHEKDWHPGSNQQVLDLVHPSLYCCVLRKTQRIAESAEAQQVTSDDKLSPADRMYRSMFLATESIGISSMWTQYQWIPSDFHIDADGRVKILSYINNLHPGQHEAMYQSIESVFSKFVPMFDRVLGWLAQPSEPEPSVDGTGADLRYDDYHNLVPGMPDLPSALPVGVEAPTEYTIKGRTVQVITKVAEIHLTPENPTYPGGSWHIEGTKTENIVATGIYYFGCENITESKLSFRVVVQPPEYRQRDVVGMATMFGLEHRRGLAQYLGAVTALEDRCIVFPNTLQHKVEPFQLEDPSKPGVRKILAFFLVDPSKKIPSTSVIPPQQAEWIIDARRAALKNVTSLPDGVVDGVLADMFPRGMSLKKARKHRKYLMNERGPLDLETYGGLAFSLCEH
ncbi:hypothetical protein PINS_up005827 [Pythium insidiosum]|nr:hypothetical protein PINS_up005827 [Pythium insidiosum]